ncbi:MAG: zinc-ribbon domain-containing protein, partial [Ectothiorhodospiraceae bacterium]|nr:zinc-ribbon domain-containing protein [Ectothiorhodospiraceae bacterium]
MYTQCPACATLYRVTEDQCTGQHRLVRCSMCLRVFDAGERAAES